MRKRIYFTGVVRDVPLKRKVKFISLENSSTRNRADMPQPSKPTVVYHATGEGMKRCNGALTQCSVRMSA